MKLSYATAAVLLFLCAVTQDLRVSASSMSISNCCLKVSKTRPHTENIIRYTVQKVGLCPVDAIVFSTRRGMKVCANPEKRSHDLYQTSKTPDLNRSEYESNKRNNVVNRQTSALSEHNRCLYLRSMHRGHALHQALVPVPGKQRHEKSVVQPK
ncbi:hypothetical protein AGOR_G00143030 [Albula goreensis]|uniref:Chemokine interleukin-8-like domain-containing protein n=1 Tax=Albula goreensis TaxID=1534307 RepID=A0A8T3D5T0_9TELE|nr:hypothetical protein AGOR_G00143030 [Albula goreensis]